MLFLQECKKPQLLECFPPAHGLIAVCLVVKVVVRKRRRNQGLGRKLMDETEGHARRFDQANPIVWLFIMVVVII